MTLDNLLDFALGQLDGPGHHATAAAIRDDPALLEQADRLRLGLHQLLDDEPIPIPAGLANRTLRRVADRVHHPAVIDFVPSRVPFRWVDVAVAAGVLLAGTLTLLPAVNATRGRMHQMGCAYNLQQLGRSLWSFADRHQHYPDVCTKGPGPSGEVGRFVASLREEDLLNDPKSLHCPCTGPCPDESPLQNKHVDYAYNTGTRDQQTGRARPVDRTLSAVIPMLADQPPHDARGQVFEGNSPNHGGRGQNVVFSDLHIEWLATRHLPGRDADLYLNNQHQPAPGVDHRDAALIPATFPAPTN